MFVPDLLLNEERIPSGLDQVRDVGTPKRMEVQARIQAQRIPVEREPGTELAQRDPLGPLRGPQRPAVGAAERRTHVGDPLVHDLRCPVPDGQHAATFRRRAPLRLAVPDVEHAVITELGRVRVAAEIGQIEHLNLVAAQTKRVDDLEQGGVPERR